MPSRIDGRLRSLERSLLSASSAGCSACQGWVPVTLYEGDPEPVTRCERCGRSWPAELFVVRFVTRDDGPQ